MPTPDPSPEKKSLIRRLMIFFALVFLAEGLGQVGGVINQPLVYFFKEVLGWAPDQVTKYLALLIIPWIIKPVYGLLSDYVPILGYRRRPYLILANGLAVAAFLWIAGLLTPGPILAALFLTCFGMAASSTITEAVLVENGNKLGMSGKFLNQQWLWFNIAAVGSALLGGWLCQTVSPKSAFHTAALIAAVAPIGVMATCWFLIDEEKKKKAELNPQKSTGAILTGIFKNKTMWVTAGFLFIWNIVPSFGTPLYYHMVDDLKYNQQFIGILGAVASVGSVLGSFVYGWLAKRMNLSKLLYLSLAVGTLGQASYVLLGSHTSAIVINVANGIFGMIALVASLTVAAHACPDKSEGFAFALLMSVNNLAGQLSTNLGAILFVHVFKNHLNPVIIVAAIGTAACALLVPILKLGNQRGDEFKASPPDVTLAKTKKKRFGAGGTSDF